MLLILGKELDLDIAIVAAKMNEDNLIVAVQRRTVIYDKEDKNHHNRDMINATWSSLRKKLELKVSSLLNE